MICRGPGARSRAGVAKMEVGGMANIAERSVINLIILIAIPGQIIPVYPANYFASSV